MKNASKWQFEFQNTEQVGIWGDAEDRPIRLNGAKRNGRGKWIRPKQLPEHVLIYLNVTRVANTDVWVYENACDVEDFKEQIDEAGTAVKWHPRLSFSGLMLGTVEIDNPAKAPKPTKIPRGVPAIRNLQQLCDHFGADEPRGLNRRLYKDTDCGASISVQTLDGKWHHNGEDWAGITEIQAFTIQTIVEGSEATVDSDEFVLPVTVQSVDDWMKEMEDESSYLWKRDNSTYYEVTDKDGNVQFYCQWVEMEDKPEGCTEEEMPLAIKAGEELFKSDESGFGRAIDYETPIPIPGTEYFVREDQGPDE